MIKDDLEQLITKACNNAGISRTVTLEHPLELSHGDFATSIALAASKDLQKNPKEIAESIVKVVEELHDPRIKSVSVAGPGFINISLSEKALYDELVAIEKKDSEFGNNESLKNKKVLVEHSSPNLFKPFHIGHLMNNTIGEAMVRIMKSTGADVTTLSFPSDVSLGIAKAVFIMLEDGTAIFEEKQTKQEQLSYIGECYVRGTNAFEGDETVQLKVRAIAQIIYDKQKSNEFDAYKKGADISLEYFKEITARLGSSFDDFIYESATGALGKKIVEENIPRVFTKSEGAVVYEGEKKGLHTRVFINKEGNPTYEAKDLGLLDIKFSKYNPEKSIFVTDHEQLPYFKVVASAAGEIHKEWQEKTIHLTHGRMQFKGERMSSRLGGIPTALEVLETIKDESKKLFSERSVGMDTDSFAEMIAIAGLKFSILKVSLGKPVNFDPEEALSFEGDSGPYIQYSCVRAKSLIEKGKELNITPIFKEEYIGTDLERILYRFEEVTLRAAEEYAPHHIAQYILGLAQAFNSWYGNTKVLDLENKEMSSHRLAITKSVSIVLENGLQLLGIKVPERM